VTSKIDVHPGATHRAADMSDMSDSMTTILRLVFLAFIAGTGLASAAGQMPDFKADRWVNSPPLTANALRGKIVLVDVWEYTCINWIRTSPYVKAWHRDYAKLGLVVIGAHAPEFEFGKRAEHIDRGVRDHGLTYPIAIDNDFAIWRALRNNAWPAKYLYDGNGSLVKRWVGEGIYDEIEAEIRRLLAAANPGVKLPAVTPEAMAFAKSGQPSYARITGETYIGADRAERGTFTLEGSWQSAGQYVELRNGTGKLVLPFTAGEVNLVMQPGASGKAAVTALLDGKPVGDARGADVGPDGVARFDRSGMIRLIDRAPAGKHVLTLVASDPGLRAYVFTFGP
ncbi:MAG: Redoxin domain protein, partial [Betaproteobacteria bacterium]|nr:Redoxin domain protein [Betaproteobacteria bacterium]